MANNLIQIKRSLNTANPGSLANGELAYTANGDILFIGSNGQLKAIGGARTPGTLTANQALVANNTGGIDKVIVANLVPNFITANGGLGSTNQVLASGGPGANAFWYTIPLGVGGSDTQVQFNDSGVLTGSAGFTFNKTTNTIAVGNTVIAGNNSVNASLNSQILSIANTSKSANLTPDGLRVGSVTLNSTSISAVDMTLTGNLNVQGTLTTIDTLNLQVKDSIIKLADQQTSVDALSIGLYGLYGNSTVTSYSGIFRDQSDSGIWKLFNTRAEPDTTVNTNDATYSQATLQAFIKAGAFVANSTDVNITANSTVSSTLSANSLTLTTALNSNSGGTGQKTYTSGDMLYYNTGSALSKLGLGTDGYVLQVNSTSVAPYWGSLDGGVF